MLDHDALIRETHALAPLSPTVVRLAELVNDPESDIQAIVKALSMDPALAGAVLAQANSARFGGRGQIGRVQDAVVRLGPSIVLELATKASVRPTVDRSLPEFGFSEGRFWRHCCAAALATEELRKALSTRIPATANAAALLHDVGKLAMAQFLSADCLRLMWRAHEQGGCETTEAEREILGVDHAELGGLIAQNWRLPDDIRHGITHHHNPEVGNSVISDVTHVASFVAERVSQCTGVPADTAANPAAMARLGIPRDGLDPIIDSVKKGVAAAM